MENINGILRNIDKNERLLGSKGVCNLTLMRDPFTNKGAINIQGPRDPGAFVNSILKVSIDLLEKGKLSDEVKENICGRFITNCIEYTGTSDLAFLYEPIDFHSNGEVVNTQLGRIIYNSIIDDARNVSRMGLESIFLFYINDHRVDYFYAGNLEVVLGMLCDTIVPVFQKLNVTKDDVSRFCSCLYCDVVMNLSSYQEKEKQKKAKSKQAESPFLS